MNEIFVDSYFYIALLNPNDQHHREVVQATSAISDRMVTTVWVLMEVAIALSAALVRERTHRWLNGMVTDENTTVIRDIETWLPRGVNLFGRRPDKNWSLTDCISFEVMSERGIARALTGDQHFKQAGFQPLFTAAGF